MVYIGNNNGNYFVLYQPILLCHFSCVHNNDCYFLICELVIKLVDITNNIDYNNYHILPGWWGDTSHWTYSPHKTNHWLILGPGQDLQAKTLLRAIQGWIFGQILNVLKAGWNGELRPCICLVSKLNYFI